MIYYTRMCLSTRNTLEIHLRLWAALYASLLYLQVTPVSNSLPTEQTIEWDMKVLGHTAGLQLHTEKLSALTHEEPFVSCAAHNMLL